MAGEMRSKLGRLDTHHIQFGPFSFLVRPDRSSDEPAVLLLQVTGPGLPDLQIAEDGVRPLPPGDTGHWGEGIGVIVFGDSGGAQPRIVVPGNWTRGPRPCPGSASGAAGAEPT
jgi:hypothetical protein